MVSWVPYCAHAAKIFDAYQYQKLMAAFTSLCSYKFVVKSLSELCLVVLKSCLATDDIALPPAYPTPVMTKVELMNSVLATNL